MMEVALSLDHRPTSRYGDEAGMRYPEARSQSIVPYRCSQDLPAEPSFMFDPVGEWNECHSHGKASTEGAFHAQMTLGNDKKYHSRSSGSCTSILDILPHEETACYAQRLQKSE
ncbi:hypothetical protein IMZ48_04905 [Candidatus Bathyarchaeota archaeon]|nr:hypothetical protein [Candidatus Bathyarchaeota archaeon]